MPLSTEFVGLKKPLAVIAAGFVQHLRAHGVPCRITSVRRTRKKQLQVYSEYLYKKARGEYTLPAMPPGRSVHEYGIAWDMVVPKQYEREVGQLWKSLGGQWGGDAPIGYDPVHFQAKQLLTPAERRRLELARQGKA